MNYGTAEQAIHWILHVCDDTDVYNQVEFLKAWEEGATNEDWPDYHEWLDGEKTDFGELH